MTQFELMFSALVVYMSMSACSASGVESTEASDVAVAQQASPITHASRDEDHPAVVAILVDAEAPADNRLLCTGSLIGPRAVLTAAHCLNDVSPLGLQVAFGSDIRIPSATLRVIERRTHPDYRPEPLADHDLAVLALERAAPSALVPFTPGAPVDDTLVKIVGFGANDSGGSLGEKRVGTALIDEVDPTRFRVAPAPSLTCFHDSGAPALVQGADAEQLVGVTSSGRSDCAGFSRFMRVDSDWDEFIRPNIAEADSLPISRPETPIRAAGGCQVHGLGQRAWFAPSAAFVGLALGAMRRKRCRSRASSPAASNQ